MWLISNGDLNTPTTMVLVDKQDELVPAVREFCIKTRTNFNDVVINHVGSHPDTDAKQWLSEQLLQLNGR